MLQELQQCTLSCKCTRGGKTLKFPLLAFVLQKFCLKISFLLT